jgi:hypothetical protein
MFCTSHSKYLFIALLATVATNTFALKPLSCEVQLLLNGTAALLRDQGKSQSEAQKIMTDAGDLTKKEIQTVLHNVYVSGKGKTPDQIKDAAFQRCRNTR